MHRLLAADPGCAGQVLHGGLGRHHMHVRVGMARDKVHVRELHSRREGQLSCLEGSTREGRACFAERHWGSPTSCPGIRVAGSSILATPVCGNQIRAIESREAFQMFATVNGDVSDGETAGADLVSEGDGAPGDALREFF